jgi:hypothetical protein
MVYVLIHLRKSECKNRIQLELKTTNPSFQVRINSRGKIN